MLYSVHMEPVSWHSWAKNNFCRALFYTTFLVITACGGSDPDSTTTPSTPPQTSTASPDTSTASPTVYRGSDAEALLTGFLLRHRTGNYDNSHGGTARELNQVTFFTNPPQTIDISTIPTGQIQSRIIHNRNEGHQLIEQTVDAINQYNSNRDPSTESIAITFRSEDSNQPEDLNQQNCTSIAISESDMETLISAHINDPLFEDNLDPVFSDAGQAGIVTSELADAVDPTWLTRRPTTPTQEATFNRLKTRLETRMTNLNASIPEQTIIVGGESRRVRHYVNPEHINLHLTRDLIVQDPTTGRTLNIPIAVLPVYDVFVHDNRADGEAMLGLLEAIRDQNEDAFFRHALALATSFTADQRATQEKFVNDFSFLFATYFFPTINDQRQNLHIFLRCGHIY